MEFEKNIEEVILFQIDRTNKAAKLYSQREFDKLSLGITVDQWVLLKILEETGPISQKELASKSTRDPASITRTLDLLGKKGFTTRTQSPKDRRQFDILLTSNGNEFVQKNLSFIQEMREQSTKGISRSELNQLSKTLSKIHSNFS